MSEVETIAVGEPRPAGTAQRSGRMLTIGLLIGGLLVGALLGTLTTLAVVHGQQPDQAAAFRTDQRLAAYRAYADQVASANDLVDQAMASVQPQVLAEGEPADPTGATARALDQARTRLNDRTLDVDILASTPVRKAYDANHRAQDDVLAATLSLFADGAVPSAEDVGAVQTKILTVRRTQAPATLVTVVAEEIAAGR